MNKTLIIVIAVIVILLGIWFWFYTPASAPSLFDNGKFDDTKFGTMDTTNEINADLDSIQLNDGSGDFTDIDGDLQSL